MMRFQDTGRIERVWQASNNKGEHGRVLSRVAVVFLRGHEDVNLVVKLENSNNGADREENCVCAPCAGGG